ncbi:unnamed protein product [Menidia menidia]|uniref:(Atlantic silverside) hypothetical protein n=1 Tax=Menidia menidia TaxID=238744 RepID=A0A8S4C117_9TELE|nr:unnamed protein product [Menidia menidia]
MAPQSCVMNLAQGSPPLAAPGETSPAERSACGVETDELDLSPVRRCKTRRLELPFSVESIISDRNLHSLEPGSSCVRAGETDCASPRGVYRSKVEAVDLSDKEASNCAPMGAPALYGALSGPRPVLPVPGLFSGPYGMYYLS